MQSRCYRCWRTDSTWPIRLPNDWSIKAFVFQWPPPPPPLCICMRNNRTDHCLARIPSDRPRSICQTGFWVCGGLFHQHTHAHTHGCPFAMWGTIVMLADACDVTNNNLLQAKYFLRGLTVGQCFSSDCCICIFMYILFFPIPSVWVSVYFVNFVTVALWFLMVAHWGDDRKKISLWPFPLWFYVSFELKHRKCCRRVNWLPSVIAWRFSSDFSVHLKVFPRLWLQSGHKTFGLAQRGTERKCSSTPLKRKSFISILCNSLVASTF